MTDVKSETCSEDLLGVSEPIKLKLLELKKNLDMVESVVNEIESVSVNELQARMNPLETAKFNWLSIYALNSLYFVYLKNSGTSLKDHPLMPELLRVKKYMTRITEIAEAEANKNPLKLDKESSARIIKRSLWQKASKKQEICSEAAEFDGKPKAVKRESTERGIDGDDEPLLKKKSI